MTTLLALLAFTGIITFLGILLARLSSSDLSLKVRLPVLGSLSLWGRTGAHPPPEGADNRSRPDGIDDHLQKVQTDKPESVMAVSDSQPVQQLIEAVNTRLPQTQCAQCGHPGCRPYATAIVSEDAPINRCPPGGDALISELAEFLGKPAIPLDAAFGVSKPPQVAIIDEPACIGCTLCILACPVDAIVGASRYMHTVLSDQCTGCELCIPPCPVDCIALVTAKTSLAQWRWPKPG